MWTDLYDGDNGGNYLLSVQIVFQRNQGILCKKKDNAKEVKITIIICNEQ